ncbi:MAG: TetR/AcrR family transcriptional regulator [Polyangiaceae bacterium]|nr:TetR/AcrR family transcriptional regulator [Polyangiaceae bacterium]
MDKRERRQALLRAARDVFASRGYHDAKVEDICAAANVAKGTYYLYFKDKRAVLEELVDGLFARLGGAILRVDVERDVRAQIEHNIRAVVAVFMDDPALTRILLSYAAGLDPAFVQKIASFYDTARSLLRDSLSEGQRLHIVVDGDTEFFATVALGSLKEVLLEATVAGRARPREDVVEKLFGFLEKGFLRVAPDGRALATPAPPPVEQGPARAKRKRSD